ncbi:hypothetical protein ACFWIB_14555 [Streptomyces sp. NPDC127051]|uniref:hypothetical protein n=1 Tax=Streptomyces sp. NPDC127051 TaxID=3347119 RepID=UPI003664EC48
MTDHPYTDDDLRTEAARQHAALTADLDFMGIGEQMKGQEVTPGGEVDWDDFRDATFEAAQRSIHELVTGAASLSEWAVELGADDLEPVEHAVSLQADGRPIVRVHFAFEPGMPEEMRTAFVEGVAEEIARVL